MKKDNTKAVKEWFRQADNNYENAVVLFKGGRFLFTVFTCQLAIEKALKGLFLKKLDTHPPRTHDLERLIEKIEIRLSEEDAEFITFLNLAAMPTRYPDELKNMVKLYPNEKAKEILNYTKNLIKWIKEQ